MSYGSSWDVPSSSFPTQSTCRLNLYDTNTTSDTLPLFSVESLQYTDLLKNPVFHELHQCNAESSHIMVQAMESNTHLLKEITELKEEIIELKDNIQRLKADRESLLRNKEKQKQKKASAGDKGKARAEHPAGESKSDHGDYINSSEADTPQHIHTGQKYQQHEYVATVPLASESLSQLILLSPMCTNPGPMIGKSALHSANSLLGIQGIGSSLLSGVQALPSALGSFALLTKFDVEFIVVNCSFESLKDVLLQDFPWLEAMQDLITSMKASPDFWSQNPLASLMAFIEQIETADPNDDAIKEDDKGVGWGHYQFTSGSMTCSLVLKCWADIGNTATTCKLIAAAIRTCQVV
ncbi:hypothetical protein BDQ17DRAFT_1430405 [Cyathus striatus]|nr:hypothetical protein BDQ17DRAFT_1430405 [Cyathus striatus]